MTLAVCTWSLLPDSVADLNAKVAATGLEHVQLGLDPFIDGWDVSAVEAEVVSGMIGCVGEDYTTIESIHRTGGVVPDETWPATRQRMEQAARLTGEMELRLVTFHAGFIPDDPADAVFGKVRDRVGELARLFGDAGCALALETGQESAQALIRLLDELGSADVGVNFDPANMLLYGSGDPIDALERLLPRVKQVHVKDADPSATPGQWGEEVVVGTGAVDWAAFFAILDAGGYDGDLAIEREAGDDRVADVRSAVRFLGEQR